MVAVWALIKYYKQLKYITMDAFFKALKAKFQKGGSVKKKFEKKTEGKEGRIANRVKAGPKTDTKKTPDKPLGPKEVAQGGKKGDTGVSSKMYGGGIKKKKMYGGGMKKKRMYGGSKKKMY